MRLNRSILAMMVVYMLVLMQGCSMVDRIRSNPDEQLYLAYRTYATTINIVVDLYDAGRISDHQLRAINDATVHARRALELWESLLEDGLNPAVAKADYEDSIGKLRNIIGGINDE